MVSIWIMFWHYQFAVSSCLVFRDQSMRLTQLNMMQLILNNDNVASLYTNSSKVLMFVLDINECLPSPCKLNATCIDLVNDFHCMCPPGFTDKTCSKGNYKAAPLLSMKYNTSNRHPRILFCVWCYTVINLLTVVYKLHFRLCIDCICSCVFFS